jgi:uncharacterized membrane protein YraQ (UPF0718 family)
VRSLIKEGKMDKKTVFAIGIVLLVFAIILVYEWGGAWKGYKITLQETETITAQVLEEKNIPVYMLMVVTIIDYIKHSWLCLLLAFIAAGALQEFVPREKMIALMGAGKGIHPYLISGLGGPMLSMCSCSIIPMFGGLYRSGAGLGPSITFLLAAPAFNPAAVLLTLALLGWKFAVTRVILAVSSGILVGYVTDRIMRNRIKPPDPVHIDMAAFEQTDKKGLIGRILNMFLYSWEFVKMVLPLIFAGVILAGVVKAFLPPSLIVKYLGVGIFPIILASALGVFMYTPTLVEVPFVRGFLDMGMGTGAAIAFLLTGPALSLPSILGVCRVINPRVPLVYATLMWICGIIGGLVFWFLVPAF